MKRFCKKLNSLGYFRKRAVLLFDAIISVLSTLFAVIVISYFRDDLLSLSHTLQLLGVSFCLSLSSYWFWRVHRNIVRNASINSLARLIVSTVTRSALFFVFLFCIHSLGLSPKSGVAFVVLDFLVVFSVLIFARIAVSSFFKQVVSRGSASRTPVMICGTIGVAPMLMNIIESSYGSKYQVAGFISSKKSRAGNMINGIPVYYLGEDARDYTRFFEKHHQPALLFSSNEMIKEYFNHLVKYGVSHSIPMLLSPEIELLKNGNSPVHIREIRIEDLLERDSIMVDDASIRKELAGKLILITGAAGSIGSEITRMIARFGNVRLLLVDNAETPMHNLELELKEKYPHLEVSIELGDVRSTSRTRNIFEKYRPQIIYHAAAYKHVPMMERSPSETIMVNVLGTRKMADLAIEYGVERFVMVSTDKAVNPTNVMGASKRIAEMYIQSLNQQSGTKFITTRFGNVLGSNGSVIPLFREQIRCGGPIKVTHPDIIRFFMTIPEACKLVLQASVMGQGGEIFVFDMGEQIRIVDMARKMIQLAGLVPDKDIEIVYTGLRPGEKLYEEVLSDQETTFETSHPKIRGAYVRAVSRAEISEQVEELIVLSQRPDMHELVAKMKAIVPEYISNNSQFEKLDK